MSDEEQDIFNALAALLGAQRDERPSNAHLRAYHFGEGELEFYFMVDWRDAGRGKVQATTGWRSSGGGDEPPSEGFSLSRSPEALAKDIRRRWLEPARAWYRKQVERREAAERREAEHRARVEHLLEANGCDLGHDGALVNYRNTYEGHGIEFDRFDITGDRSGGYKLTVSVRNRAALYKIARVAGQDFRTHRAGER